MASCIPMIIAFLITAAIVVSTHSFLMNSIDKFDRYGDTGGSFREWTEFEKQKNPLNF